MMLKKLFFCILIASLFSLTGCWDNKDINHRMMPVVLGISKEQEEYKLFLQIPKAARGQIQTIIVRETGTTINQIIDKMSANLESSVDLLHAKVIIVDRSLAEEGMKDFISGFMRSRDVPSKALMVISQNDIEDIFTALENQEHSEETVLLDFFEKNAGWNPQIPLTRVWQVYQSIHSYTKDVSVAMINKGENSICEFVGGAVIKNGKMVEMIDPNETLLYNAFNDESNQGKIEVLDEGSVMILGNRMNHDGKLVDGKPHFHSKLRLNVMVLETRGEASSEEIKQALTTLLLERYNRMFSKIQSSEADIFGIGQHFRKEISREELKEWRSKYYPELVFTQEIIINIQNEGNLKMPAGKESQA
ncbi:MULTISPECIES: Ger(x)C family spore germination protein [unclassified Sutcliffiella]|uniref:Ger(x)C family spore germination protein n=1 Tax=unclassified Sutcliffiella TaxID=2837532 RepID=UPI0030D3AE21